MTVICIIERDRVLRGVLTQALEHAGIAIVREESRALLAVVDDARLCSRLSSVPVVVLGSSNDIAVKIQAFENGAADYIAKPFDIEEFVARVRSLIRRLRLTRCVELGGIRLDLVSRDASAEGVVMNLTEREFLLLELLMRRAPRVVTRDEIAKLVWGVPLDFDTNRISVHLRHLREKLGASAGVIETVLGKGYRFIA